MALAPVAALDKVFSVTHDGGACAFRVE